VLRVVRPTPATIQSRSTELFKIVKDAIDAYLRAEAEEIAQSKAQAAFTAMDIDSGPFANMNTSPEVLEATGDKLEDVGEGSLFAEPLNALPYVTPSSIFFGSAPVGRSHSSAASVRYTEIIDRIHGSLVLTPTVPAILASLRPKHPDAIKPSTEPAVPVEPEMIPFVPASQRQKATSGLNSDKPAIIHTRTVPELDELDEPEIVAVKGAPLQKLHKTKKKPRAAQYHRSYDDPPSTLLAAVPADTTPTAPRLGDSSGSVRGQDHVQEDRILLPVERKERKRKRKDLDGAVHHASESVQAVLPYDYSGAPDILDQGNSGTEPQLDKRGKRRKKDKSPKQKVVGLVSGVASGQRSQTRPNSGNRSMTFKS